MPTNYEIRNLLKKVGVSPDLSGYFYLSDAIEAIKEDMEQKKRLRQFVPLYGEIGKAYGFRDYKCAERCMRHAILKAWKKYNEKFAELFPDKDETPTLSAFICTMAEHLLMSREV